MHASKAGAGDLSNLRLSTAVSKARALELPKDRINFAVERGAMGKGEGEEAEVIRYDGVLKVGGATVPVLVMAVSDNRNRTGASVRAAFKKCKGEVRRRRERSKIVARVYGMYCYCYYYY